MLVTRTLKKIEVVVVVVFKWQHIMSNFCRLSGAMFIVPRSLTCKMMTFITNNLCRRKISPKRTEAFC